MLEELFYNKKVARTIEYFIIHADFEQNQKEMCGIIEVYPKEMIEILNFLVKHKIIKETRRVASLRFYLTNKESELFIPLRKISQKFAIESSLGDNEE